MRPRSSPHFLLLLLLAVIHPSLTTHQNTSREKNEENVELLLARDERSAVVHFPDDNKQLPVQSGGAAPSAWRFQSDDNQLSNTRQSKSQFAIPLGASSGMMVPVPGTRAMPPGEGVKKGRKAKPDVQDIISGIVHLLGGKVNLHAANGAAEAPPFTSGNPSGPTLLRPQMLAPHSTRINNRAPPRIAQVPFEAIPLELGNSAGKPGQSLPFGVPLRPPVFPPKLPQTGQNVQGLPFTSGIPLPIQLVPPVSPNRPWPPTNPLVSESPLPALVALTTENTPTVQTHPSPLPNIPAINLTEIPAAIPQIVETTLSAFFPEDSSVRHPTAVAVATTQTTAATTTTTTTTTIITTTTTQLPLPESTTILVHESSSIDISSILQPSIEDESSSSSLIPLDVPSPVPAVMSSSLPVMPYSSDISSSLSVLQSWPTPSTVPQLEAGTPPNVLQLPDSNRYTPPLPSGRPGQVFHDEYLSPADSYGDVDVITSDNIQPHGTYGDTFELVVTAAQNFGGSSPPVNNGRPYVIPVDIDNVRGGLQAPASAESDEYVSIDGRKTYFNLFPTETVDGNEPMVQATAMPKPAPMSNNNGYGYAYPDSPVEPVRPAAPPRLSYPAAAAPRPSYPKPAAPVVINRPTASLIRRPSTTPLSRIDACIVGDPNACLEPNESCQAEEDGSACSCKPGFGRKKSSEVCKGLTGLLVSIRLDRLDNQRLAWSSSYSDPSSPDYQQLQWEANKAINSLMEMAPLSSHFVSSSVNKFYAIGNKIIVNASVFLDSSPETQSVTVRPTLQRQLSNIIQQRNNNLGISRLWVEGPNPIPVILDLNECGAPELNDCSPNAECINNQGSFSCECKAGFSDPYPNDPFQSGRQCNSCTRSYCNNRGECRIENGRKTCSCQGNYKGQTCELDGEVLGVAIGASVAAVVIIVLTLVLLCMWSRRWRQNQEKMVDRSAYMEQLKTMPFPAIMQDRIRWAQYAEAMASAHNLYATPMPPPYFYQTPSTLQSNPAPSLVQHPTLSPPPIPPRNKVPVRQAASLPVGLVTSTASQMINNLQELARKISRKKKSAPRSSNNIYFEADAPSTSNDFSNQSQVSLNTYQPQRQGHRYYYR
ncbi:proline-rich protein 36-like isoform X4 [Daphnia pulicaria]|uniref:proline-rich protein 36-like isoform X4 n=1 Tax=Daphnia pulicaria TaxID=35523 RepID=UPI001EEB39E0|nr:proline-rich protein 36-like isoform X4 [Daphnia pulicaria]